MFDHHSKPFHHLRPYQIERRAGVIKGVFYFASSFLLQSLQELLKIMNEIHERGERYVCN